MTNSNNRAEANNEDAAQNEAAEKLKAALVQMNGAVGEVYSGELTFIKAMSDFVALFNKHKKLLYDNITKKDAELFTEYMRGFEKVSKSADHILPPPARDIATPTSIVSYCIDMLKSPAFLKHHDLMTAVGSRYHLFQDLLLRITDYPKIQNNPELTALVTFHFPQFASQPFQRVPRYLNLMQVVTKAMDKFAVIPDPALSQAILVEYDKLNVKTLDLNSKLMYEDARFIIAEMIESESQASRKDTRRNPIIFSLKVLDKKLRSCIEPDGKIDRASLEKNLTLFFTNAYIDYRSKGFLHTIKPQFLIEFESKLIKLFDIQKVEGKHNDEMLFAYIDQNPKLRDVVVENLFTRSVAEGIGSNKSQLFVNSIKALERLGDGKAAKKSWNKLASDSQLSAARNLTMPADELYESNINNMYNQITSLPNIVSEVQNSYPAERLMSLLKDNRPVDFRAHDIEEMDELVEHLGSIKDKLPAMHTSIMNHYIVDYEFEKNKRSKLATNNAYLSYLEMAIERSGIAKHLDPNKPNKDLTDMVLSVYVPAYLQGRTKTLLQKTDKTAFLDGLESSMMTTFNLKLNPKEHAEEAILRNASRTPEARAAIVNRLFTDAMAQGIASREPQIFVNAAKLVVRMGNEAISTWNKLIKDKLNFEAHFMLPFTGEKAIAESKIKKIYEAGVEVKAVRATIINNLQSEILINELQKNLSTLDAAGRYTVNKLIKKLEASENLKDVNLNFVNAYIKAYIDPSQNELRKALESVAVSFNKITGGLPLLAGNTIPGKEKHIDAQILSSVTDVDNAKKITQNVFNKAIEFLFTASKFTSSKDQKIYVEKFVNSLKAIVRMKTTGQWQELAEKKNIPELVMKDIQTNYKEKNHLIPFAEKLLASGAIAKLIAVERENKSVVVAQDASQQMNEQKETITPKGLSESRYGLMHHDKSKVVIDTARDEKTNDMDRPKSP